MIDFNATQAAIRAGMPKASAHNAGSELLKRIDVQIRVAELMQPQTAAQEATRDDVIRELGRMALVDVRKVFDANGARIQIHQLDDDTAAAVESFEVGPLGDVEKIKFSSKLGALKELGKHFNIYEEHQKAATQDINIHIDGKDALL